MTNDAKEWVEIKEKDFTVAFGRGPDQKLMLRIQGQKNGVQADIEWYVGASWVRNLLDTWFPGTATLTTQNLQAEVHSLRKLLLRERTMIAARLYAVDGTLDLMEDYQLAHAKKCASAADVLLKALRETREP